MEGVLGYIALGANLGKRGRNLRHALHGLRAAAGVTVLGYSPIYETSAHTRSPQSPQPDYLNAVVEVRTTLLPGGALAACKNLERQAGRIRRQRWAPRTLDADLLALDTFRCNSPDLCLPHPRLAERRFVLLPWADLAPNYYIGNPFDATVSELLTRCPDKGMVRRTSLEW